MYKRKHWSERRSIELYALKSGTKFYPKHELDVKGPYTCIQQPYNNGIMTECKDFSGKRVFLYSSTQVVKEKLTDINSEL
jgi:hypothetical protein